jgi:hypothetical protein
MLDVEEWNVRTLEAWANRAALEDNIVREPGDRPTTNERNEFRRG